MALLRYMMPSGLILFLIASYWLSPQFYLEYIIHPESREFQFVEILTALASLFAGIFLLKYSFALKKEELIPSKGGYMLTFVVGLAALFFFAEECSWGQTYFQWQTPAFYKNFSGESNLHNSDLPINSMGSWFIAIVFFVLPLAAKRRFIVNEKLRPVLPDGASIFCMILAFSWKAVKTLYVFFQGGGKPPAHDTLYYQFIEQINEHKEMLVAVGLLMYALHIQKICKERRKIKEQTL
jgi:hypothetical protein